MSAGSGLTCALCAKLFVDPVIAPCGHSFCLRCVEQTESSSTCPLCRQPTAVCSDDVEPGELPANLPLTRVSIAYRDTVAGLAPESCAWDAVETAAARARYCPKCAASVCSKHSEGAGQYEARHYGETHSLDGSALHRLFCEDCDRLVCSLCVVGGHAGHHFSDVQSAAHARRAKLTSGLERVDAMQQQLLQLLRDGERERQRLVRKQQKLEARLMALKQQQHTAENHLAELGHELDALSRAVSEPSDQELLDRRRYAAIGQLIAAEIDTELSCIAAASDSGDKKRDHAPPAVRVSFPSPSPSPLSSRQRKAARGSSSSPNIDALLANRRTDDSLHVPAASPQP